MFALSRRQCRKKFREEIGSPVGDAKNRHDLCAAHDFFGAALCAFRVRENFLCGLCDYATAAGSSAADALELIGHRLNCVARVRGSQLAVYHQAAPSWTRTKLKYHRDPDENPWLPRNPKEFKKSKYLFFVLSLSRFSCASRRWHLRSLLPFFSQLTRLSRTALPASAFSRRCSRRMIRL